MTDWRDLGEAVVCYPDGESTAARFAMTADRIGYGGIVLRNGLNINDEPTVDSISEEFDLPVFAGTELSPETPDSVSGRLPHLREQTPMLLVAGGTEELNRFISAQPHVDVMSDPIGPNGPDLDPGIATQARESDVAIEVNLAPLRGSGGERVRYLDRLRRLWRVIEHYEAPYVISMSPTSHLELVAPREIAALGELVGIDETEVRHGLSNWLEIASGNRHDLNV